VNDHGCLLCATKALTLVTHFWQAGPHPNRRMCANHNALKFNLLLWENIETTASVEKKIKVDMETLKSIWNCSYALYTSYVLPTQEGRSFFYKFCQHINQK